jgi:hypothetical protein
MATGLIKASKSVKGSFSVVRAHLDAVERARELYLAAIKRAEADYFERIKAAMEILHAEGDETAVHESPQQPEQQQSAI